MRPIDWRARGNAYMEAADHLTLDWTEEDPWELELFKAEKAQAKIVSKRLNREADKCFRKAKATA